MDRARHARQTDDAAEVQRARRCGNGFAHPQHCRAVFIGRRKNALEERLMQVRRHGQGAPQALNQSEPPQQCMDAIHHGGRRHARKKQTRLDRPVHAAVQGGHLVVPADVGLQVAEQVPGVDGLDLGRAERAQRRDDELGLAPHCR